LRLCSNNAFKAPTAIRSLAPKIASNCSPELINWQAA
jgi:hypothetical protein